MKHYIIKHLTIEEVKKYLKELHILYPSSEMFYQWIDIYNMEKSQGFKMFIDTDKYSIYVLPYEIEDKLLNDILIYKKEM